MIKNKIGDLLSIAANILAIIVASIALISSCETRIKTIKVQEELGTLAQETRYLAYYTKIIAPEYNQHFKQQYVEMDVTFGKDPDPGKPIWVVGFDGNNRYPLKKIDMAKGQPIWSSNIELPHMQEWTLYVYLVDTKNSKALQKAYESKQPLKDLASNVFGYLTSVKIVYDDRRKN